METPNVMSTVPIRHAGIGDLVGLGNTRTNARAFVNAISVEQLNE